MRRAARRPYAGTGAAQRAAASGPPAARRGFLAKLLGPDLLRLTLEHLGLVVASVGAAALVGIPLAVAVAPHARARAVVLGATGLLQTVPALALLAALISLVGRIGTAPALLALTLYALLPVMRNTVTGLAGVPPGLKLSALALGMTPRQRLHAVELPLALPTLVAGLRTATAIAIGTATIAAFIGAGGYGERIVTGLALNDRDLLLAGALPAAALALAAEGMFEWVEARCGGGARRGRHEADAAGGARRGRGHEALTRRGRAGGGREAVCRPLSGAPVRWLGAMPSGPGRRDGAAGRPVPRCVRRRGKPCRRTSPASLHPTDPRSPGGAQSGP